MKKIIALVCALSMLCGNYVFAENVELNLNSESVILLDVYGNIIYEINADEQKEPASVTKIMTMLLAMEALENDLINKDDLVVVSKLAEGQGGSQVFLETGEVISVDELLKSIAVSSANDASVALGEHIAGTNDGFIALMNERATELGMENTFFVNSNGLPEDEHLSTARDIAIMSVELLKYDDIYNYTTIWMDSIRDGEFELANTNKMLKTYNGLVGLKTGYTSSAKYCISATAIRENEQFIAVVMGAETVDERTEDVETLLNYAFNNYKSIDLTIDEDLLPQIVSNSQQGEINVVLSQATRCILAKKSSEVYYEIEYFDNLVAPIEKGMPVGLVSFYVDGQKVQIVDILSDDEALEINFKYILGKFLDYFFIK